MVDLETLALSRGAVILSVGACRWSTDGIHDEFYRSVDRDSCEDVGLTVDDDTLDWWKQQDDDVRDVLTGGDPIGDVLTDFSDFYGEADEIWANSPSFDCVILEAAYEAVGNDVPWTHKHERDYRTLRSLPVDVEVERGGAKHDALDDARYQARVAAETIGQLRG
jgi:hypothetical protein